MATALNRLLLSVGEKGVGKSTITLEFAVETGKRIIVLDNVFNQVYTDFERIKREQLPTWRGARCIVEIDDFDMCLRDLSLYQRNAFIISEDSRRYLSANVSKAVETFIIDHRKFNFDVAFMFHSLKAVPPKICEMYTHVLLFKTKDNLEEKQPKWMEWHLITPIAEKVRKQKNHNYFQMFTGND